MNGGCHTKYKQYIKDIGANDITKCHINLMLSGSHDRGCKLRQTCSKGHNGQTDQILTHSKGSCNRRSSIYYNLSTCCNSSRSTDNVYNTLPDRTDLIFILRFTLISCFLSRADHPEQKSHKQNQQNKSINMSQRHTEPAKNHQYYCHDDRKRKLSCQSSAANGQWTKKSADATNHHQVKNIGAYGISYRDTGISRNCRTDTDRALRQAGSHCHNGQPND